MYKGRAISLLLVANLSLSLSLSRKKKRKQEQGGINKKKKEKRITHRLISNDWPRDRDANQGEARREKIGRPRSNIDTRPINTISTARL